MSMSYRRLSLILALNAIFMFAGCEKQPATIDEPVIGEQKVAFAINADCGQTRTTNDGLKTAWEVGDALTVFYKHNGKFETAQFTYSGEGSIFTGEVYTPDEGGSWIAEYPYNAGAKAPAAAPATVNAVQVQDGYGSTAHLAGAGFPLTGRATYSASAEAPKFAMSQVLSQCRFNITNGSSKDIVITGIEFTAPVAICGGFTADLTAAVPVWSPATDGSSCTVRLDVSDGTALEPDASAMFSLGMMPFSVTDGEFKITVHATCDGKETVSEKTVTKSMTFAANTIGKINYTFETADASLTERDLGSFNLVNSTIQPYLTAAAAQYGNDWSTGSIVDSYPNGGNGDLNDKYKIGDSHITAYDKPAPVTIPLTEWNGTQVCVTVYNDQDRTDVENSITATVANGAVDFFNLIPGRTYWYTVTANASEIDKGHFQTTGDRRLMKVSDAIWADRANNCRDFGGLKGMNGKTIKYNLMFRGSNMNEVTADEKDILLNYMGIGLDVDLRATSGTQTRNVASNPLNVNWSHEGISGGSDLIFNSSSNTTNNNRKKKVKNIFTAIFDSVAAGEAVYIHCFAGADRTGYVCCVLEAVLGVSEKDCSIDYELTSFSCVHTRDRDFQVKGDAAMATCYPYLKGLSGSTFQDKAITYLKSAGITDAQIAAFQNAMLE